MRAAGPAERGGMAGLGRPDLGREKTSASPHQFPAEFSLQGSRCPGPSACPSTAQGKVAGGAPCLALPEGFPPFLSQLSPVVMEFPASLLTANLFSN